MALFDENVTIVPAPRRQRPRGVVAGIWALVVALVVLLVLTFLPTAYVIQQPGPVYDTLGTVATADGEEVPLISVEGAETYPTDGTLDLLTVQVVGNPERTPSWFELALAWFDRTRAVIPLQEVYPVGQTTEQRNEESSAMMVDSQQEATAAALGELGYDIGAELTVYSLADDSPAAGVLEAGDVILAVDGQSVTDAEEVREIVGEAAGEPVTLTIERDGSEREVSVTPSRQELDGEAVWLLGVTLTHAYDFPIDVTIQLDNVGGPSAGMMFALGIIDTLTPGQLNGGAQVAGTGTISGTGEVGPIGGIRQKLWGAEDAGAEIFLAPTANCGEVVGHVPDGLQVFAVDTLGDAIDVLETVSEDGDVSELPTCTS